MKINWNENPAKTTIELDSEDKEIMLISYKCEEYEMLLAANRNDGWEDICNLTVDSPEFQSVLEWITYEHMGDCTCVPCSCLRCQAEDLLGISTLPPLGKHSTAMIFGLNEPNIDSAIQKLGEPYTYQTRHKAYKDYTEEDYNKLLVRWNKEREQAQQWLMTYKEDHRF